ncbi:hypothetical protein HHI36_022315 [Cryptolaemus montrouzieri]|uniref:Uncharacterized protein n=1 Tax=Cryptolaemus montrouzieri TaxID=559131 RepID=A0ABD2MZF4_9CUCU
MRRKTANIEGQSSSTLPNDREMDVYNTNDTNDHAISLECISSDAELDQTMITSDIITCNSPKLMCSSAPLCRTPVEEVVKYDAENDIAGFLVVKIPLLVLNNGEHHCAISSSNSQSSRNDAKSVTKEMEAHGSVCSDNIQIEEYASESETDDSDADPDYRSNNSTSNSETETSNSLKNDYLGQISDIQNNGIPKTWKRKANSQLWRRNKNKMMGNNGRSYEIYSKTYKETKKVPSIKLGPPCPQPCRLKCSAKFNEADRSFIFKKF